MTDTPASGGHPWLHRLGLYVRLVRLHKPIGILLLVWPTLWALFVASHGWPPAYPLFAFCLGTVLMRSAGCAINDFADRDFDGEVARTVDRPLARKAIAPWEAVAVFVVLSLLLLVWAFAREGLSSWYWVGIVLAAGVAVYHYFLIRHRTREGCFAAFNHNNWFGAAVFLGVLLGVFCK